jgi:hypothetical protein
MFQAATTIKESVVREWTLLEASDIESLRSFLLRFITQHITYVLVHCIINGRIIFHIALGLNSYYHSFGILWSELSWIDSLLMYCHILSCDCLSITFHAAFSKRFWYLSLSSTWSSLYKVTDIQVWLQSMKFYQFIFMLSKKKPKQLEIETYPTFVNIVYSYKQIEKHIDKSMHLVNRYWNFHQWQYCLYSISLQK